jgi:hypothetical protein
VLVVPRKILVAALMFMVKLILARVGQSVLEEEVDLAGKPVLVRVDVTAAVVVVEKMILQALAVMVQAE